MNDRRFKDGFRSLIAWQEAHKLTVAIYQATRLFPRDELFGVTSQLRRASASIGAQIAEGSRMSSSAHRRLYYERSYASGAEVDNFLELAFELKYINEQSFEALISAVNKVSYLIKKLKDSLSE